MILVKATLTQKKGDLTNEEETIIGKTPLVFGCDVCQEVCPHNQSIPATPIPEFQHVEPYIDINEIETLTNKEFKAKYGHRAFSWRGKKILIETKILLKVNRYYKFVMLYNIFVSFTGFDICLAKLI